MERLRVLVADDHPLLRQGVQTLLSHQFDVVGAVSDGQSLIDMAAELRPDIIVTDISMPLMSGLDAVRQIKRRLPATMFVFLTVHSNPVYVQRALQVHASAYVLKSEAAEELLTAIEHALRGEVTYRRHSATAFLNAFARLPDVRRGQAWNSLGVNGRFCNALRRGAKTRRLPTNSASVRRL